MCGGMLTLLLPCVPVTLTLFHTRCKVQLDFVNIYRDKIIANSRLSLIYLLIRVDARVFTKTKIVVNVF
jgi:hypothetical protein